MLEWQQIIAYIVTPLLTAAIGAFMLYLNVKFDGLKEKITNQDIAVKEVSKEHIQELVNSANELREVKANYIGRFDEIKDDVHKVKDTVMDKLNAVDKKVDVQAKYCELVQELKKKGQ